MIEVLGFNLGTFFQLLTTAFSGGIFAAILTFLVKWRGLKNINEADIRDHYAEEVQAMRGQLMAMERHYREMLEASDKRHAECEAARAQMRHEIEGLKRQIVSSSADRLLGLEPSELVTDAAKRVRKIIDNTEDDLG